MRKNIQQMHNVVVSAKPFNSVRETVAITGLSERFIRDGIRSGEIPCIMSGSKYLVNLPGLLQKYDALVDGITK